MPSEITFNKKCGVGAKLRNYRGEEEAILYSRNIASMVLRKET